METDGSKGYIHNDSCFAEYVAAPTNWIQWMNLFQLFFYEFHKKIFNQIIFKDFWKHCPKHDYIYYMGWKVQKKHFLTRVTFIPQHTCSYLFCSMTHPILRNTPRFMRRLSFDLNLFPWSHLYRIRWVSNQFRWRSRDHGSYYLSGRAWLFWLLLWLSSQLLSMSKKSAQPLNHRRAAIFGRRWAYVAPISSPSKDHAKCIPPPFF